MKYLQLKFFQTLLTGIFWKLDFENDRNKFEEKKKPKSKVE